MGDVTVLPSASSKSKTTEPIPNGVHNYEPQSYHYDVNDELRNNRPLKPILRECWKKKEDADSVESDGITNKM